jgi:hypothetical protein
VAGKSYVQAMLDTVQSKTQCWGTKDAAEMQKSGRLWFEKVVALLCCGLCSFQMHQPTPPARNIIGIELY